MVIPAALVALMIVASVMNPGTPTPQAVPTAPSVTQPGAAKTTSAPATKAPEPAKPTTKAPAKTTTAPAKATTTAPAKTTTQYNAISARDFKLLAKDPDAYAGKTYKIYGEVTQFDSATGTDTFRANTGATKASPDEWYAYEQNTILDGDETMLSKVVEDDLFEAKVVVEGAYSYDTQIGGSTTVPRFRVIAITVYGSSN